MGRRPARINPSWPLQLNLSSKLNMCEFRVLYPLGFTSFLRVYILSSHSCYVAIMAAVGRLNLIVTSLDSQKVSF